MAHCPSCGFEGTPKKGYCPNCRSKMEPGKATKAVKRRDPRKKDNVARGIYWGVMLVIMLLLMGMLFYPPMRPYGEGAYEAFMKGLDHYKEIPDYAEFEVERELSISVPGDIDWVEYTLRMQKPVDMYMFEDLGISDSENQNLFQDVIAVLLDYEDGGRSDPMVLEIEDSSLNEMGDEFLQVTNIFTNSDDTWQELRDEYKSDIGIISKTQQPVRLLSNDVQTIRITYHIRSYSVEWAINKANSGYLDDIPGEYLKKYVDTPTDGDQWLITNSDGQPQGIDIPGYQTPITYRIQPTHPDIQHLAAEWTEGKSTVFEKVEAIYDKLDSDLEYLTLATGEPPKNCLETWSQQTGGCDDQSILFISLCRAIGIPAWLVGGVLYDPFYDVWVGHGWAQCLIPLKEGGYITPTVDVVNNHFLVRDPARMTDWVDDGSPESLEEYYSSWTYTYDGDGNQVDINDFYTAIDFKAESNGISIKV